MADKWDQYVFEDQADKWDAYAVDKDFESNQEIATAQQTMVDPFHAVQPGPVKQGLETMVAANPTLNVAKLGVQAMQPGQITRALMNKATDNYSSFSDKPMLPAPAQSAPNNLQDIARLAMTQGPLGLGQAGYAAAQPHITPRNVVGGLMDVAVDPLTYIGAGASEPAQAGIKGLQKMAAPTVEGVVDEAIMKIARPSVAKGRTMSAINQYKRQAATAVKSILRNRGNLGLTDEIGNAADRLPQSLEDMSQAINTTKKNTFRQYDVIAKQAGEKGITIDLEPLAQEYLKVADNEAVRKVSPEMANWALKEANKYSNQKVSPSVAQDMIELFNQELKAFYRNPTMQTARKAAADAAAVAKLRMVTDQGINSAAGGPAYQALKNEYGSLRAIEDDINRRLMVHSRQSGNKPFGMALADVFAKGDMLQGILTMSPEHMAAGGAKEAVIQWIKRMHNPDRMVKKMFEKADEAVRIGKSSIDLPRVKPQPRLGVNQQPIIKPQQGAPALPAPGVNQAAMSDPALGAMRERQVIEEMKQKLGAGINPGMTEQRLPDLHQKALEELSQEPSSGVLKKIKPAGAAGAGILATGASSAQAGEESDISTSIISQIESQNNPDAVNKKSGAVGVMQIMEKGALADWNKDHPKNQHNKAQLKDPQINMKIGTWYLNEKIPAMLKAFKINDTIENRLIAYNAGIGNLRKILAGKMKMPNETSNYVDRYFKLAGVKAEYAPSKPELKVDVKSS